MAVISARQFILTEQIIKKNKTPDNKYLNIKGDLR
jgi:hypothetical protein